MLNRFEIERDARNFLLAEGHPIENHGDVTFPEEETDQESEQFLKDNNIARVCFNSNDPNNNLIPGVFIVYVNIDTGNVHMPRHMV